jgi:hypothetical protein
MVSREVRWVLKVDVTARPEHPTDSLDGSVSVSAARGNGVVNENARRVRRIHLREPRANGGSRNDSRGASPVMAGSATPPVAP